MGLENRDYYREHGGGSGWGMESIPPVCKYLIIANVVVFLLQIFITREPTMEDMRAYWDESVGQIEEIPEEAEEQLKQLQQLGVYPRESVVEEWLELDTEKVVRQAQIWRLLTHAFCHDRFGIWHILFNMLFLYWFGKTLLGRLREGLVGQLCYGFDSRRHDFGSLGSGW